MSFLGIGGGSGILSLALEGAMAAATGGSSLLMTTALKGVMLSIGDQVLQQLGQQMGLPPAVTSMASSLMHAEAGDFGGSAQSLESAYGELGQASGASDYQTGQLQQQGFDGADWLLQQLMDKLQNGDFVENGGQKGKAQAAAAGGGAAGGAAGADSAGGGVDSVPGSTTAAAGGSDGDSFLLKLAEALGKVIDDKMDDMVNVANQIDQQKSSGSSQTATLSAQETALGQEVSLISNALNTAIKSLGDAASTLARKS